MSKQLKVVINNVEYFPVDPTRPPGESSVNYRALIEDKLNDFPENISQERVYHLLMVYENFIETGGYE